MGNVNTENYVQLMNSYIQLYSAIYSLFTAIFNYIQLTIYRLLYREMQKNERRKNCAQDNAGKKCRKTAYRKTVCRIMQARAGTNLVKMYKLTMCNVTFRYNALFIYNLAIYRKNDKGKP